MQDPREEVIQAWYMDDSDEDQRLPHHREPKEFVSLDQLAGEHFEETNEVMLCLSKTNKLLRVWHLLMIGYTNVDS